jgi:hypothetical protein
LRPLAGVGQATACPLFLLPGAAVVSWVTVLGPDHLLAAWEVAQPASHPYGEQDRMGARLEYQRHNRTEERPQTQGHGEVRGP